MRRDLAPAAVTENQHSSAEHQHEFEDHQQCRREPEIEMLHRGERGPALLYASRHPQRKRPHLPVAGEGRIADLVSCSRLP